MPGVGEAVGEAAALARLGDHLPDALGEQAGAQGLIAAGQALGGGDDVRLHAEHRLAGEEVAEAAVVPVAHDIKGSQPNLYIALKPGKEASDDLALQITVEIQDIRRASYFKYPPGTLGPPPLSLV